MSAIFESLAVCVCAVSALDQKIIVGVSRHFWIVYFVLVRVRVQSIKNVVTDPRFYKKRFPQNGPVDPLFRRSASLSVKRTQNQSVNSNLAPL